MDRFTAYTFLFVFILSVGMVVYSIANSRPEGLFLAVILLFCSIGIGSMQKESNK